jgi:hypothetical protein
MAGVYLTSAETGSPSEEQQEILQAGRKTKAAMRKWRTQLAEPDPNSPF